MGRRIFLLIIVFGSMAYGVAAMSAVVRAWWSLPRTVQTLERDTTPAARTQARYFSSAAYQGQLVLTGMTGALFLAGALGLWLRRPWAPKTLFGGAWVALVHMAWLLITSLEWFRSTGTGMLYQINVLNVAWVLLILAVAPTERLVR